jgi:ADP-heptose:LPS heptosyltransferase
MILHDYTGEIKNFADTAALMENLDLLISVCTSTAHLAGAMGRPIWLLNRFDTDWRWFLDRGDSPWYPTMRIFRQPHPGDWTSVVHAVVDKLRELVGAGHPD